MKYLEAVQALYEKDVDVEDDDVFGVHGTSIEAIRHLATQGRMPV